MGTATSLSDIERSATLKLEATSHSAKHLSQRKKTDLWAQKGTVKAVILFPRFDVAHIHQKCRATLYGMPEIEHFDIGVEAFGERPIALSPSAVTTSFRSGFWPNKWRNSARICVLKRNCSPRYAARSYCLIMSAAFPSSAIRMASIGLYPSSAIESR